MKIPYLGKMMLFWCDDCNVPVLGGVCAKCSGKTKKVELTPPGDIRPAFKSDVALINKTAKKEFGSKIISKTKADAIWVPETWGMENFSMLGAVSDKTTTQKIKPNHNENTQKP